MWIRISGGTVSIGGTNGSRWHQRHHPAAVCVQRRLRAGAGGIGSWMLTIGRIASKGAVKLA